MNKQVSVNQPGVMSKDEWSSRVECAAGHHLLELYNLTDLVEGVLAVRVKGESDAYLLKPYRLFYDEVSASDLVKVRFDDCLLYTSPSPRDGLLSRMPSSA